MVIKTVSTSEAKVTPEDSHSKRQRQEQKAGLLFPVARLRRYMEQRGVAERISTKSAVAMAAMLEFLCAEVLETAADSADAEAKGRQVKPRHLRTAIQCKEELNAVLTAEVLVSLQDYA